MTELIPVVNQLVTSLTLGGQIIIGVVLLVVIFRGQNNGSVEFIQMNALILVFLIAAGAVGVSLFYSNVAGYTPCDLCWWQRIFMYSIFIVSMVAAWKNDKNALDYLLALTICGAVVALYHVYIQYGGSPLIPCAATAEGSLCTQRFVFEYNYITIPLMSLTGFAMIATVLGIKKAE